MAEAPMLEVRGLSVELGGAKILEDVSFALPRGGFTAVLGPNGSGKTTLLRALYRAVAPTRGESPLAGRPRAALERRALARQVAVLRQEPELAFDFLVEELVLMGRAPHQRLLTSDRPEDRQIAARCLALTDAAHLARRSFGTLSGGEKQRVLLARALAQEPQLLLLDEPTNHLDVRHQLEVLTLAARLGITVIAALHDLNQTFAFADRALLLHRGRLLAFGAPAEVLAPERIAAVFGVEVDRLERSAGAPVLAFSLPEAKA